MNKQQLAQIVRESIENDPSIAPAILQAVAEGMGEFEKNVHQRASHVAGNAIDNLLHLLNPAQTESGRNLQKIWFEKLDEEQKCISLFDALHHRFPNGFDSCMSIAQRNALNQFCLWYFEKTDLYGSDWECNIKSAGQWTLMLYEQWQEMAA